MRDIHNNVDVEVAVNTTVISGNGDTVGAVIDRRKYQAIEFVFQSGTLTDGAYAIKLEESDVVGFTPAEDVNEVDDIYLLGTEADAGFALADDNVAKKIGVKYSGKRYVRATITASAVTTGGTIGATVCKYAELRPTA